MLFASRSGHDRRHPNFWSPPSLWGRIKVGGSSALTRSLDFVLSGASPKPPTTLILPHKGEGTNLSETP